MNHVILIHGAWAGAWVWEALSPLLEKGGCHVHALDLPGNGHNDIPPDPVTFEDCVAYVEAELDRLPQPAFLVAHSGGGVIATQAAENRHAKVAGIVYVAGMMLPSGIGFAELTRQLVDHHPAAAGIGPHLIRNTRHRCSEVPAAAACDLFFQDVNEATAMAAARRLTPQPEQVRAGIAHWTPERFGALPRLYVEARQDRSVVLAAQRWMQQQVPGGDLVSLNTGHVPQLSEPDHLSEVLLSFFHRTKVSTTKGMPLA
ncbi:putative alkyl salicylate esterase [Alcanivorax xiamenensis]|uniref:Alkyl salicylate esterase n=1 Tax=Alcanivorax xiamenensis TaxID=1177156 RepID=A0ABQ6Y9U9_9GAMM|nr:alpha/beta fold hydrolase [Alcanivorax xiamenensis]KAF0806551.1 putative alkyl salicylate esterase [Alcanivorax xiamenensis]